MKKGLEEERDTAVAIAQSLEHKISEWDGEMEKYKTMSWGILEKVKNARREAIELFLQSLEYCQDITQQYFDGFEAMRSRAALAFPNLDFSKFEVDDENGPSCLDGGQKEEEEGDDAASKDTSIPSSSIASFLQTPEKVSLPLETPIPTATPPGHHLVMGKWLKFQLLPFEWPLKLFNSFGSVTKHILILSYFGCVVWEWPQKFS
ncbi:hypothetical protein RHMOL_Rhmol06G0118800 [Rhododendron molle]|uniref:Uncharacterized protein n=1 Tax=Rhododendron molle TaxID=49168 RepID=A0ACC0NBE6_RHOML|nr:hypothetical protein RHMOL_Rhmol06G0118800 [Rhododendron molle]